MKEEPKHNFSSKFNESGEKIEVPKSTLKDIEDNAEESSRDLTEYLESDRTEDTVLLECMRRMGYIVGALKFYLER